MTRRISSGINVDRLDQLIKDLGVRVKVFRSTLCPNMTSLESHDHDINCKICRKNFIDFDPQETIALFQQQTIQEQFKVQGSFHIDEIMVSFLSGFTLAPWSRVELLDFEEDFYELIQRQENTDVDKLKYAACSVEGIFLIRKENGVEKLVRYYFDADFTLNKDGNIKWKSANRPKDREIYSIYYKYHPTYRAMSAVHRDRYSQFNERPSKIQAPKKTIGGNTYIKMPETWMVKREYLPDRFDENGNNLSQNTYYDPNQDPNSGT
jgi:hypothetical protein